MRYQCPMRGTWVFGLTVLVQLAAAFPAAAQAIPKPDYVTYLPRETPLPVQSTAGNRRFNLFGDPTTPGYRDEAPRDGIDDARGQWLRSSRSGLRPGWCGIRSTSRWIFGALSRRATGRRCSLTRWTCRRLTRGWSAPKPSSSAGWQTGRARV